MNLMNSKKFVLGYTKIWTMVFVPDQCYFPGYTKEAG